MTQPIAPVTRHGISSPDAMTTRGHRAATLAERARGSARRGANFQVCPGRFFCSVEAPFSCPGHSSSGHRAQLRSRLGAPAPTAKRRGLDRSEHGVTLKWSEATVLAGSWFFPRSAGSRNMASGRSAPLCPERGHRRAGCSGKDGVVRPRPGWDMLPPTSGGSRWVLWAD
jgi:hypothetical protein